MPGQGTMLEVQEPSMSLPILVFIGPVKPCNDSNPMPQSSGRPKKEDALLLKLRPPVHRAVQVTLSTSQTHQQARLDFATTSSRRAAPSVSNLAMRC